MGLNILKSFKDFANELVAKVKQAIDLLDEPPVPKQVPLSDNRGGYQKPVSTTSPVAEVRNVPDSPQKSLLKVVLYWLNSSYFQPIDVEICKDSQNSHSISLVYADNNKAAIESLSKSLQKDRKFWVHVGHIKLSDVLAKPFEELNWDKSELKGHTVLFEMKVNFVEVDNTALNLDDELIFEYQKGTLRVSPYLFLFSLFKNGSIKEIKKNFNVISLHKEFCERWETTIREYKISTNSTKTYFTLRSLKQWMDCCLKELGWNDLIKLPNEPGSNEEYIATFSKVDEKSDSVIPQDFYFDDLYHIFQEALKEPKYCGVLMPMVHALFQPAITPQSWYSNKHIKQYIDKRYYTAARWPSPYSPVLMQQMAINLATDGHEPVFSVNGPPGTGKTTLLKDIIAQKVFERAKLIAEQKGECFESPIYFRAVALRYCKPHTIHPLKRQFKDCNMLVASCNNAAVENLTRELPDWANMPKPSDLVGDSQEPFDYFRRQATALLQELKQDQSEAWGLIAVPLGKQDNIACFIKACLEDLDAELLQIAGSDPSKALQVAINRFNTQLQAVEKMRNLLGTDQWQSLDPDSEEAQKGNPFHHDAFNREREKLFYASLAVLKQFNALPQMRDNLDALKEFCCAKTNIVKHTYFSGHSIKDGKQLLNIKDLAPTLYDTMFSLVPVVSTTFASVKSMFGDVKAPGRLGCLIVDEAGQASPHMAAGALWRASKTIVVGDPKQVEPVVKTDAIVKRYCRKLLQLEDVEFLYEDYSLQTMADLTNHYGGYIGEHIPSNWVGCPLRVHRRCCEPMFTISNTTSYGGTMILGGKATVAEDKVDQMLLPHSCWYDVAGKVQHNNHYVSEQGNEALKLVDQWLTHWMPIDEKKRQKLYVISPFKSVVRDFKKAGYSFFRGHRDKLEEFRKWANVCVGTVHTFQGKEAEEVIILLGCDQTKVSSAKWVNANMVNVAVTRAKCRVYFIGDWAVWKQNEVFANNVVFQPKESAGEPLVRVNDLALLQPTDQELPLLTEEQDLVEEGSAEVIDREEHVPSPDSTRPTDQEPPLVSEEQYLADIGLDKYLHLCLLQLSEKDPGKLYVMDMKRRWFYQFSYDNTAIAFLDGSRASWFDDTLHKCRIQCTLVYPLKIAEEDKSYIKTGIYEAIQFVQTYLANQQKDMERYLQRHHSGH